MLYVNAVTTAGSFNLDYVNGSWSEGTIYSNAPPLGSTIASNVSRRTKVPVCIVASNLRS